MAELFCSGGQCHVVALYAVGTLILIIGVLYICHLVHLPEHWTIALAILLFGGGLMGAVSSTRQRDKSE